MRNYCSNKKKPWIFGSNAETSFNDLLLNTNFLHLVIVNILMGLIQPLNYFVGSMLTGKFLGVMALNAYALVLPFSSLVLALSAFFAIGTQICVSSLIAKGKTDAVKTVTGTAYLTALFVSVLLAVFICMMPQQWALVLGADSEVEELVLGTAAYLQGYVIGMPAVFLLQIMLPLMQIEGKKSLATLISFMVFVVNVAGSLVNLFVFDGGLFGMALAMSVSNIGGLILALIYLLFFTRLFPFSLRKYSFATLKNISKNGLPSLAYYGSIVIRTAFFNFLILSFLDGNTMAVMVIVNSFLTVVDCAIGGTGDAVLLLGGVLNGEKDRKGQKNLLKRSFRFGGLLLLLITIFTFLGADTIAVLFSESTNQELIDAAARALRITALCFVPDMLACILKKYVQSVGRAAYTSITNILCNVVYACGAAFVLVCYMGADGLFLSYTVCYVAALITHILYARYVSEEKTLFKFDNLLFISPDDRIPEENVCECMVRTIDECDEAAQKIYDFCKSKGASNKLANYFSLITEERTVLTVKNGLKSKKQFVIMVKVMVDATKITLHIKDNSIYFNPLHYYESVSDMDDLVTVIGLNIKANLSENMTYSNSFNLNYLRVENADLELQVDAKYGRLA